LLTEIWSQWFDIVVILSTGAAMFVSYLQIQL